MDENDLFILILRLSEPMTTFAERSWRRGRLIRLFYGSRPIHEVPNRQIRGRLTSLGWCHRGDSCSADIIDSAKSVTIEASVAVHPLSTLSIEFGNSPAELLLDWTGKPKMFHFLEGYSCSVLLILCPLFCFVWGGVTLEESVLEVGTSNFPVSSETSFGQLPARIRQEVGAE